MGKSFADDFIKGFKGSGLPREIISRFDELECLAQNEYVETFLLEEKGSGKRFVLKQYKKTEAMNAVHEAELLRGLEYRGLPVYEREIEDEASLYILREFVSGVTLDEYIAEYQPDESRIVSIITELCNVLSFLHSQPSPIIHRDIKPTNIIVDPRDNTVTLIDFGISRKYSEDAEIDTICFGTQKFAPPEQYGFAQTDCRADIYALGVVFRYMLTGTTSDKADVKNNTLRRIISKCCAFSPNSRYQNTEKIKKELEKYSNQTYRKIRMAVISLLLACFIFATGLMVGRYTDFMYIKSFGVNRDAVVFSEPLIEDAVRAMLGKEKEQLILEDELKKITDLYIIGEEIATSVDEWEQLTRAFNANSKPYGTLENLNDINKMINLTTLWIMAQPLSDLSPLENNVRLRTVTIKNCNVSDVTPLINLPLLRDLEMFDNLLNDFSAFSSMKALKSLGVGNSILLDVSELGDMRRIESLSLHCSRITSLDGISNFPNLKSLSIAETLVRDFSPLDELLYLENITISPDMEQYLTTSNRTDVEILTIH